MSWSLVVTTPEQARAALADPPGALDLRALPGPDGAPWSALGFVPLADGSDELVRPVPLVLPTVAATRALGARIAVDLRAGDLVVLTGPLGAGKTALVQGLAQALGVAGAVTSPTFVLARTHRGTPPLVHADAYRLRDAGTRAVDDLDLDTDLPHTVTVVEWGEGLVEHLAASYVHVVLQREPGAADTGAGDEPRLATVTAHGLRWSVRKAGQNTVRTRSGAPGGAGDGPDYGET